jgi:hypothetical protein
LATARARAYLSFALFCKVSPAKRREFYGVRGTPVKPSIEALA